MQRARQQQGGDDRARKEETFLRNEWGTRVFGFASLVVDPPNGRMPELTPAAKAKSAAVKPQGTFSNAVFNTFDDFTLYDRCITRGIFGSVLPSIYGNGIRITQSPNQVSISYEMIHDTRVVDLSDKKHLEGDIEQYMGNARGHWEGDTLVVDTTNFTDKNPFRGSSENLHLIERFTRTDANTLLYEFTVDDPSTFTRPWTAQLPMTRSNERIFEYACHEGNYALPDILRGARYQEKQSK
jgi:hypothetical protein